MKANLEYNLPEDQEEFNVGVKAMDWAILAWDIDQSIRSLLRYGVPSDNSETGTGTMNPDEALEHLRDQLHDIMEEKGLQFPA